MTLGSWILSVTSVTSKFKHINALIHESYLSFARGHCKIFLRYCMPPTWHAFRRMRTHAMPSWKTCQVEELEDIPIHDRMMRVTVAVIFLASVSYCILKTFRFAGMITPCL